MKNLLIISLIMGMLSGCTAGTIISKDGTTEIPKWHDADYVIFNKKLGTFPNLQSLKQITKGMTKDQIYELIGRPQYNDGWRPREWNYLFHFNTLGQGENDISTCQFKILFDNETRAASFYWNPIQPESGLCPPNLSIVQEKIPDNIISTKRYNLSADALFIFDKYDIQNLNSKGKMELSTLVSELKNFNVLNSIKITAYTDRLGSQTYNQKLSQNRAETIKQYLVNSGLNNDIIFVEGKGSSEPIAKCDNSLSRDKLINCLAPNRRVSVIVDGYASIK